jgi:hypothetical protein
MKRYYSATHFAASVAALCWASAMGAEPVNPAMSADDARLIASAESAAPAKLSKAATIVAMDATGKMRTLRQGNNGWTCMPDNPSSPGADPMCLDKVAIDWLHALMAKRKPAAKVGFIYMLAGGSDASNTDPYATKPALPNHWITTGPHVMVVGADQTFYDAYPSGVDPDTSVPYIMWAGTPYQHLMAPVK